jgi:hypothetical protein
MNEEDIINNLKEKYKKKTSLLFSIQEELGKMDRILFSLDMQIKKNIKTLSLLKEHFPLQDYYECEDVRGTMANMINCLNFKTKTFDREKEKWSQNIYCSDLSGTCLELDKELIVPAYLVADLFEYNKKVLYTLELLLSSREEVLEVFGITFKVVK